ncbi:MAG: dihydrofolate reductase [Muribaculaceae bacterium]|nr:dihydrofolate reductase [Muribaculaceae bacterium]
MPISIIVATTTNGAIGRGGDLLFHISEDLRNFKRLTGGHTVIMGRNTYESLPNGPLPNRTNIVITRNHDYNPDGVLTFNSLCDAIRHAIDIDHDDEVFIIGGGQIYTQALPYASRLYLTEIGTVVDDADTFFPAIDPADWSVTESSEWITDPKNNVPFRFICLSRN